MNKTIFVVVALFLIASLVLCGCAKKAEKPAAPSEEKEVEEDLSELEGLDKDLDMSELEGVEKDLEGLDW